MTRPYALWVRENGTYPLTWFERQGVSEELLTTLSQAQPPLVAIARTTPRVDVSINFVGATSMGSIVIYSLPKFLREPRKLTEAESLRALRILLQAIRKSSDHTLSRFVGDPTADGLVAETRWLRTAHDIVDDFIKHGRYFSRQEVHAEQGEGEIDWDETISNSPVILQRGRPVYLSSIIIDQRLHSNTDIARLHVAVLSEITRRIEQLDPIGVLGIARPVVHSEVELSVLGDKDSLLRVIDAERRRQYEDRKLRLLDLLDRYINAFYDPSPVVEHTLAGTTNFDIVWERMCAWFFRDAFHTNLMVTNAPRWTYMLDGIGEAVSVSGSGSLIPDTVTVDDGDLYIFDAKYYVPIFGATSIARQPGATDVAKQLMYVPAVEALWPGKKVRGNAFVFPATTADSQPLRIRGLVELPFLENKGHLPISVLEIDPLYLSENYNRGARLPAHLVRTLFTSARTYRAYV